MSDWEFVKPKKRKQKSGSGGIGKVRTHNGNSSSVSQAKLNRAAYLSNSHEEGNVDLPTLLVQVTAARQALRTTSFYAGCVCALQATLTVRGGRPFCRAVLL